MGRVGLGDESPKPVPELPGKIDVGCSLMILQRSPDATPTPLTRRYSRNAHPQPPRLGVWQWRDACGGGSAPHCWGCCWRAARRSPTRVRATGKAKLENTGELGGPPTVPDPQLVPTPTPDPAGQNGAAPQPNGCTDPDDQVIATCLNPVGAIAVLPDARTALVGERATGRILRVQKDTEPQLVATISVDATGGGGLTGLVLSPGYAEDHLVYAYITTPSDNRVVRIAAGEGPKPVLVGIRAAL